MELLPRGVLAHGRNDLVGHAKWTGLCLFRIRSRGRLWIARNRGCRLSTPSFSGSPWIKLGLLDRSAARESGWIYRLAPTVVHVSCIKFRLKTPQYWIWGGTERPFYKERLWNRRQWVGVGWASWQDSQTSEVNQLQSWTRGNESAGSLTLGSSTATESQLTHSSAIIDSLDRSGLSR